MLVKQPAALLAAAIALALGTAAACSSSGGTEMTVSSEIADPVQTPTPLFATPEGASPTPEPAGKPTVTPTESPDAPGLVWTEVDLADALGADEHSTIRLESVGDGRVLAMSFVDRGINKILVTDDSTDWAPIPVPAGFLPWEVDIIGDRWVIQGWDSTVEAPGTQILFSDDQGASWTELVVDLGSFEGTAWITDAIVAGERIVVMAQNDAWQPEIDQALDDEMANEPSEERVHLFLSNGGPPELAAEFPGWASSGGYGASDGFHLILYGPEGDQLLYSPDGRQWTITSVDVEITDSARSELWTTDETDGKFRVERFEGVYGWDQVLTLPDGIGWMPDLAVGPAGVAAVGGPASQSAAYSEYDPNQFLVGWSADGTNWQWQTLQEAFGLPERSAEDGSFTEVQVAVGPDFVLAQVQTFEFPQSALYEDVEVGVGDGQSGSTSANPSAPISSPICWFIARVD